MTDHWLDAAAAQLMAATSGWVVVPDDRYEALVALPAHLHGAFWIRDSDPDRLADRMSKVEEFLREEVTNAPAGRMTRRPPSPGDGYGATRESPVPARPVAPPPRTM